MTPPPGLQSLIETVQHDSPSDEPLDLLVTASTTAQQLEATTDALLGHFVDQCRRSGRSWSQISAALGVSKQAVHKRFSGPIADRLMERPGGPTLERLRLRGGCGPNCGPGSRAASREPLTRRAGRVLAAGPNP